MSQYHTHTLTFSTLPERSKISHKGNFGHVLIIGGSEGFEGAAILAAEAAYRLGAGKVSVLTGSLSASAAILARLPEVMCIPYKNKGDVTLAVKDKSILVLGPGLGLSQQAHEIFDEAIASPVPMLIDADALTLLSKKPIKLIDTVLTPHPLEAARLLGYEISDSIQKNRIEASQKLYEKYDAIIVLKGAETVVTVGSEQYRCPFGNPKMATAGMGDVLSGIIAGLFASGLSLEESAKQGVALHAKAGDEKAKKTIFPALLASDISLAGLHPDWSINQAQHLHRHIKCKNYTETLRLVNQIARLAEEQDHHPILSFGWGYVEIELWSHDKNTITSRDIRLAQSITALS